MKTKIFQNYLELFKKQTTTELMCEQEMVRKFEVFTNLLIDYCSKEEKILKCYRILDAMHFDLNFRKKLILEQDSLKKYELAEQLDGRINTEMEIVRYKIQNPHLKESNEKNYNVPKLLKWTDNKVSLVEVMYAIAKSVNDGNASIKEIADCFEFFFQVDLGNYYHTLTEINLRKSSATRYLDTLPANLNKVLDNLNR